MWAGVKLRNQVQLRDQSTTVEHPGDPCPLNINSIKIKSGLTELVARAAKGQEQGRSNDFSFDKNKRSGLSSEWLASVDGSIVITK